MKDKKALILGGAGFIGSAIARKCLCAGHSVTIIDGLLKHTGGKRRNIEDILSQIRLIDLKIENVADLKKIVNQNDVIIDCMGWTAHCLGMKNPGYDLELNCRSHLVLIEHLSKKPGQKIIYLGSRCQYGETKREEITETTNMIPIDVQGIHKLTAESYYRIFAKINNLNVISLRLPNCFGENQPIDGEDVGLIGGFIKDTLADKIIEVYGENRKREFVYVKDVADIICQLSMKDFAGFDVFNLGGHYILIEDLVKRLIRIIGRGKYKVKPIPPEVGRFDAGNIKLNDAKLKNYVGGISLTDLNQALISTIDYFEGKQ